MTEGRRTQAFCAALRHAVYWPHNARMHRASHSVRRTAHGHPREPSQRHESLTRARSGGPNRGHLREEPYEGKPHVRICEGESRTAELLDLRQAL